VRPRSRGALPRISVGVVYRRCRRPGRQARISSLPTEVALVEPPRILGQQATSAAVRLRIALEVPSNDAGSPLAASVRWWGVCGMMISMSMLPS